MYLLSLRSSKKKRSACITLPIGSTLIYLIFILHSIQLSAPIAAENKPLVKPLNEKDSVMVQEPDHHGLEDEVPQDCRDRINEKMPFQKSQQHSQADTDGEAGIDPFVLDDGLADVVNPFKSTCYDWRGNIIPCDLKRQYAELMFDKPIPEPRFIDNKNGTVTDDLTGLTWLKNANCFGMMNWEGAKLATKNLKDGDCGPDPALILSDGSSEGDWRLPTMSELCTLIDFSRRDPALPNGHMFSAVPLGYHWSATTLDYHAGMVWIVYFESGTTCYEAVTNQAGHILPVR